MIGEPDILKIESAFSGCFTRSETLFPLPFGPYFRKYSDWPVFEGTLWMYLGGVGTSDTLTTSNILYFFRLGSSDSYLLIFWGFLLLHDNVHFQGSQFVDSRIHLCWLLDYRCVSGCWVWIIGCFPDVGTRSESVRPSVGYSSLSDFYWSLTINNKQEITSIFHLCW